MAEAVSTITSDDPASASAPDPRRRRRRLLLISALVVAALVGSGVWFWSTFKYDYIPKRWGVVEPGRIYRSGQLSQSVIEQTLRENRIAVVVDLTGDEEEESDQRAQQLTEQAVIARMGIAGGKYPLAGDGTGDIHRYAEALTEVNDCVKQGMPVLIHCSAGTHRTGAAVAYYRMLIQGRPGSEAFAEIQRYGWSPKKHAVLTRYVNDHMAELAQLLVERGVIERVPEPLPVFRP